MAKSSHQPPKWRRLCADPPPNQPEGQPPRLGDRPRPWSHHVSTRDSLLRSRPSEAWGCRCSQLLSGWDLGRRDPEPRPVPPAASSPMAKRGARLSLGQRRSGLSVGLALRPRRPTPPAPGLGASYCRRPSRAPSCLRPCLWACRPWLSTPDPWGHKWGHSWAPRLPRASRGGRRACGLWSHPCLLSTWMPRGSRTWRPVHVGPPPASCKDLWKVRWAPRPHTCQGCRESRGRGSWDGPPTDSSTGGRPPRPCPPPAELAPWGAAPTVTRPAGLKTQEERGSGTLHHEVHRLPLRLRPKLRVMSSDPGQRPPAAHEGLHVACSPGRKREEGSSEQERCPGPCPLAVAAPVEVPPPPHPAAGGAPPRGLRPHPAQDTLFCVDTDSVLGSGTAAGAWALHPL